MSMWFANIYVLKDYKKHKHHCVITVNAGQKIFFKCYSFFYGKHLDIDLAVVLKL